MRKEHFTYLIVFLFIVLASCQNDLNETYKYDAVVPELKVETTNLEFEGKGGQRSFNIKSNTFWTVSCSESWIHLSSTEDRGVRSITVTADNNPSTRQGRNATITVSNGYQNETINIKQALTPEELNVSQESVFFSYSQNSATINVNSNVDWTVSSPVDWCLVKAINSKDFEIRVSQNSSYSPRSTDITVQGLDKSLKVLVEQAAAKEPSISNMTITDITNTTAIVGMYFSSTDLSIIQCGICYSSTTSMPTIDNSKTLSVNTDTYSSSKYFTIEDLTMDTEYYVRGYVKTVAGITYCDSYYFKTLAIIAPDENDNITPNL